MPMEWIMTVAHTGYSRDCTSMAASVRCKCTVWSHIWCPYVTATAHVCECVCVCVCVFML
jgi:hypothetical protein